MSSWKTTPSFTGRIGRQIEESWTQRTWKAALRPSGFMCLTTSSWSRSCSSCQGPGRAIFTSAGRPQKRFHSRGNDSTCCASPANSDQIRVLFSGWQKKTWPRTCEGSDGVAAQLDEAAPLGGVDPHRTGRLIGRLRPWRQVEKPLDRLRHHLLLSVPRTTAQQLGSVRF